MNYFEKIVCFIFRDLILRVMLKIVRLSLQDRPPPNTNHLYIENTIKVCEIDSFFFLIGLFSFEIYV